MAIEFAFHSNDWDGEDYAMAAASIITGIAVNNFISHNFGNYLNGTLGGGGSAGTVAALTTLATALIDDGFNQNWGALATSSAMAFATGYATAQIGLMIGGGTYTTAAALATSVGSALGAGAGSALLVGGAAMAGIGIVVAIAASQVVSSVYKGQVFHEGEFGSPDLVLNSIYQVQTITVNGQQVPALVAVNANGSTVIASGTGIGYVIGNSGADVLVGDANNMDTITGNGGSDYLEGRGGEDNLLG
ncbi:MAG TPA: hypothetical protein VEB42_05605, partial [Chitinophagaceae bacterium]|nr:hypothetical protein [Chitinophagaceae bacterium]